MIQLLNERKSLVIKLSSWAFISVSSGPTKKRQSGGEGLISVFFFLPLKKLFIFK
jgi:hypothetical protein